MASKRSRGAYRLGNREVDLSIGSVVAKDVRELHSRLTCADHEDIAWDEICELETSRDVLSDPIAGYGGGERWYLVVIVATATDHGVFREVGGHGVKLRSAIAIVFKHATADYCFEETALKLSHALDVRVETASLQYAERFDVAVPSF